jgi:hypothetical protein
MLTLWRVVNDMDMVARVPFTPCTLFNGGAGDENHMLMTKGVIKVPISRYRSPNVKHQSMLDYCVIGTGIRIFRNAMLCPQGYSPDEYRRVWAPTLSSGVRWCLFGRRDTRTALKRTSSSMKLSTRFRGRCCIGRWSGSQDLSRVILLSESPSSSLLSSGAIPDANHFLTLG